VSVALAPNNVGRKGNIMKTPAMLHGDSRKRLLQGALIGFVATCVIGFGWGGWTLGSTAKQMAFTSATAAVVGVLAPMCADKFQLAADAPAQLAELKKIGSWQQANFVEKGGWATTTGTRSTDSAVAEACANLLRSAK
jgi:hypothetical protein